MGTSWGPGTLSLACREAMLFSEVMIIGVSGRDRSAFCDRIPDQSCNWLYWQKLTSCMVAVKKKLQLFMRREA